VPLYEYKCKKCKHRFEKIRKFSDRPFRKCPECGGPVEQLLSRSSVQFKGSGFYATDYGRKGSDSSAKSDSGSSEAGDTASKAAEKSESKKPESKTDSKSEAKTGSKSESKTESRSKKKSD
jgi:putative FmdB family regulatory protein